MPLHPREHPLSFTLHNLQGEPVVILGNDPAGQTLHLTLINRGTAPLLLPAGSSFQLLTRAGFLEAPQNIRLAAMDGWQLGAGLVLTTSKQVILAASNADGDRIRFKLDAVKLDKGFTPYTTRVELKYNLPGSLTGFLEQALTVVHHIGKKVLPVHVGIVGSRTILNNGQVNPNNTVRMRLTNTGQQPLSFLADTTFTFSFDVDDSSDKRVEWALGNSNNVRAIHVTCSAGGSVRNEMQGAVPVLVVNPFTAPTDLPFGGFVDFVFSNFSTAHPSGETHLHMNYREIPGYWDSRIIVPLQKSPLAMVGNSIGVNTAAPGGTLEVAGSILAGTSELYFTKTDHFHTGFGNTAGRAAIENSTDFDALMILGRAGTTVGRKVRLWDYLEVNGNTDVTGNLKVNGKTTCGSDLEVTGKAEVLGNLSIRTGDRLQFGGPTENTDPVYFFRSNDTADRTVLHLVLGDNPDTGPNMDSLFVETRDFSGGSTNVRFVFNSDGNAFKAGTQPGWGTVSDARVKHDVQPLEGSLDRILQLQGKSFYYNDPNAIGAAPGQRMGFVAQEVEGVFPQWVGELEGMKTLTIGGGAFEANVVEALRELRAEKDAEIEQLKRQIAALMAKVAPDSED